MSLELKKTDAKKSKFTLVVYADDKRYEKKDRNLNEPLQFYSGKDPGLYEIVVNSISFEEPDRRLSLHAERRGRAARRPVRSSQFVVLSSQSEMLHDAYRPAGR